MNARPSIMVMVGLLLTAPAPAVHAGSGEGGGLVDSYREAMTLIGEDRFAEAQAVLEQVVQEHGDVARATIGPAFGNVLYQLGVCYRMNGNLPSAALSFERAYTDYPNTDSAADSRNAFHRAALVSWAEAEQLQQQYPRAILLYARAVKTETRPDQRARLVLNLGICLRETGKVEKALTLFRDVVNQDDAPLPLQRRCFLEAARILAEHHGVEDVREWLDAHPDVMACSATERYPHLDMILDIGQRCVYMGSPRLGLRWFDMLADPDDVRAEIEGRIATAIGSRLDSANDEESRFLDNAPAHVRNAAAIRVARAHAYYQLDLHRLALPLYEVLAENSQSEKRAEVLHAAAVCSALLDRPDNAGRYADLLRDTSPDYSRYSEVVTAHAQALLRAGRYDDALSVAQRQRETVPEGRADREPLDFVVASALFQLEQYPDAQREFARFYQMHPASAMVGDATYYEARSALQMKQWREAGMLLASIQNGPAGATYGDGILYYRGLADLMLNEVETARDLLQQIEQHHPRSPHLASALNLQGDIAFRGAEWDAADTFYRRASRRAVDEGKTDIAALADYQRIRIARIQRHWNSTIEHYDSLVNRAPDSPFRDRAAVEVAFALEARGDAVRALALLLERIDLEANAADTSELGDLLQAYAGMVRRTDGSEELMRRLEDFPLPHPLPHPLTAWLYLVRISTLEDFGTSAHDEDIEDLYRSLVTQFEAEELEDIFLLKLARWLRRSGEIEAAVSYYTVLAAVRWGSPQGDPARIELAQILAGNTKGPGDANMALTYLRQVETTSENPEWIEAAVLESARIYMVEENWTDAADAWSRYLSNPEWMSARGEASYQLAACKDQLHLDDAALAQYVSTYINHEGQIEWSARAFVRSALIQRERGHPERALEILGDMMERMGHVSHPVVNKARTLYREWNAESESNQLAEQS